MKQVDAAFSIANNMSDINSAARALIAGIKQLARDGSFQHALREPIVDTAQRLESILNREVK